MLLVKLSPLLVSSLKCGDSSLSNKKEGNYVLETNVQSNSPKKKLMRSDNVQRNLLKSKLKMNAVVPRDMCAREILTWHVDQ